MDSTLEFNFFNIFILSASIQGLIFSSVVLFSKKFNAKPNKYLSYYILLVSLNNIYYWFFDTNIVTVMKWKYYWYFPIQWDLLMFPALFYFVSSYLGSKKMLKFYMYPFYITLPIFVFYFFRRFVYEDTFHLLTDFYDNYSTFSSYLSMLFSTIAVFHAFKLIEKYRKENTNSGVLKVEVEWLRKLLFLTIFVLVLWVVIFSYNSLVTGIVNERITTYVLWISMSLLTYRMGYLGIYHLGIFNQRQTIRSNIGKRNKSPQTNNGQNTSNRFQEIDYLIKEERLYLSPNLSLSLLSAKFNLSEGYLSQLINNNTGNNFSTYLNNLRIQESKLLLTNNDYKNYTIIAIALESGFNSKSTFYNAFKKHTGISPSEFRKSNTDLS